MRTYDMTPLYRSTVGFDRLFNELFDTVNKLDGSGYPPYNIELADENNYRITLAVAGFGEDDLDIEVTEQTLAITGKRNEPEGGEQRQFLHQGIAGRSFERRFQLAEHVRVTGASLENGLLNIDLEREIPEAKKPRKIEISQAKGNVLRGPGKLLGKNDAA
ncbi:Hsp20 family protein [Parvularcula flava]|uniref:Heat-shock protein Hsp20 n=1 Tax=Aquisalinus luteolus TaxID=1566827 RepID=A0A8J3ET13_9PROT|nr:Hsp20 family protein [Aquisalinus luteolus]NHK26511.1 Hsp20 family protein [Aquisalinus luteolus]GGH92559.1 heat-shock protein Hsp20 [Aquisalinus luteolus]